MRKYKLLTVTLVTCCLFSSLSQTALANELYAANGIIDRFTENTSSESTEDPYLETIHLTTVDDLLSLAEACRLDTWSLDRLVILEADIDLTGTDFTGIPTFGGTFDGNGHTIRGLSITKEGNIQGLFRYLQSTAILYDLHVEGNIHPTGASSTLGGIAGTNAGQILECTFTGQVNGTDRIGGLVGNNEVTGILEDCSVYGTIQGSHFIGGLVGDNHGVIRDCTNHAQINTTSSDNNIALEDITLESITNSEAAYTTTDMGGIAGTSSGVIRSCINHGNVGYPSMSYNAGGIAGSLTGYLVDCENHGTIHARKDVGGIVGQLEPSNVIDYDEDTLQILSDQIGSLNSIAHRTSSHANSGRQELENQLSALQTQSGDAHSATKTLLGEFKIDGELPDPDTITAARSDLSSGLHEITGTIDGLNNSLISTTTNLVNDLKSMTRQIQRISNTLNHAEENLGVTVTDISDLDTDEDTVSKIVSCENYGPVHADQNGGGIVGTMGLENDLDPEDDVSIHGDLSLNLSYETRAVTRHCHNQATVQVKKAKAGGIVGTMTSGAVLDCINLGTVNASTAKQVGGIAGSSSTIIRRCDAKGIFYGQSQVGGIAGIGSTVTHCRSLAHILCDGPESGAILGSSDASMSLQTLLTEEERSVSANYYLAAGTDIGAVDGISYDGCAQPMDLEYFLAIEELPDYFTTMTIRFVAEGHDDIAFQIPVGEAFPTEQIPAVPATELHDGRWDGLADADLSAIWYDMTFPAVYDPYAQTLQTEDTRESGLPLLLAEGDFPGGAVLTLEPTVKAPTLPEGAALLESWQIAATAESELTLHYQLPTDALKHPERIHIYVQSGAGSWSKREATLDGSYLVFGMAQDENTFCALQMPVDYTPYYLAAGGAGILITLILIATAIKRIRKKHQESSALQEVA